MNRFEGKTVLVTGGNSGIGLATAQAFAAEGARVVITGRDAATLAAAKATLGANALAIRNDAGSVAAARELAAATHRRRRPARRASSSTRASRSSRRSPTSTKRCWDETFNTNVKGAYFQIQALLPLLNKGASIVLNGSINAHIGMPASSVYAASKAALISLAKTLSAELLPRGVRVNVVSPGPVSTPLLRQARSRRDDARSAAARLQARCRSAASARRSEVAATVLHLASPESGFIVGTEIIIDGGMSQL